MSQFTNVLAGLIILNDQNVTEIEATQLLQDAPLLRRLVAVPASNGTEHKFTRKTVAPGVGFRAIGAGIDNAAGKIELVTETLKLLDASFNRDKALALGYAKGRDAYMASEGMDSLAAALFDLECQILNGTENDAAGFLGLDDLIGDDFTVDAGGDGGRSVYIIRSSEKDVAAVIGNDGRVDVGDIFETIVLDGSGDPYNALAMSILAYGGLQVPNNYCAVKIQNLDGTTGHQLTDDLIYEAIAKFPAARQPNLIVMNRVSLNELRSSRTATNSNGAPAPRPTDVEGIEIVVTDALGNAEAAEPTPTTA